MPITVSCSCLNTYRVKDELAGKRIKCPHCQQPVTVPMTEFETAQGLGSLESNDSMSFPGYSQGNPYPQQQLESYPSYPSPFQSPQPTGQDAASTNAFSQIAQSHGGATARRQTGVNGGQVLGGIGMMVGAVVWFFLGLMAGRLFFYPPILFIIGLVTFIKGLVGSSS